MNAKFVATAIASTIGFAAGQACAAGQSGPITLPTVNVHAKAPLVIDCHNERQPRFDTIAQLFDTSNPGTLNADRDRIDRYARRECMHGVDYVAFVRDERNVTPSLSLVVVP